MIYFLKGIIHSYDKDNVIIDVNNVGYQVLVSNVDKFPIGKEILIYTYNVIREDEQYLVGFSTKEEKDIFLSLIKVKGLGPKTVISALKNTTPKLLADAISSNNVAYLKKLPGIGTKAANQIILDLKGELTGTKGDPGVYQEVYDALKELGFKGAAIDRVLATINEKDATSEEIIRIALTKLR